MPRDQTVYVKNFGKRCFILFSFSGSTLHVDLISESHTQKYEISYENFLFMSIFDTFLL